MNTGTHARPQMLRLSLSDADVLRACYMPLLKYKGLFVPSLQCRRLGETLFVVLMMEQQDIRAAGLARVCWVTPEFCSDGRETGYGLHFDRDSDELRAVIESVLNNPAPAPKIHCTYTF